MLDGGPWGGAVGKRVFLGNLGADRKGSFGILGAVDRHSGGDYSYMSCTNPVVGGPPVCGFVRPGEVLSQKSDPLPPGFEKTVPRIFQAKRGFSTAGPHRTRPSLWGTVLDQCGRWLSMAGRILAGRVEDWRGVPKVWTSLLLPVSVGSASIAEP
jgi:hypothetical protein